MLFELKEPVAESSGYRLLTEGNCEDNGLAYITDTEECNVASTALGLNVDQKMVLMTTTLRRLDALQRCTTSMPMVG